MVRGRSYDDSNHFTKLYAEHIQQLFDKHHCLGFENELMITKLKTALETKKFSERSFSSALGNRKLELDEL